MTKIQRMVRMILDAQRHWCFRRSIERRCKEIGLNEEDTKVMLRYLGFK